MEIHGSLKDLKHRLYWLRRFKIAGYTVFQTSDIVIPTSKPFFPISFTVSLSPTLYLTFLYITFSENSITQEERQYGILLCEQH